MGVVIRELTEGSGSSGDVYSFILSRSIIGLFLLIGPTNLNFFIYSGNKNTIIFKSMCMFGSNKDKGQRAKVRARRWEVAGVLVSCQQHRALFLNPLQSGR